MTASFGQQLKALGYKKQPQTLLVNGAQYHFCQVFKHDFFAATFLYTKRIGTTGKTDSNTTNTPDKIVLKISRDVNLLGLPLQCLGRSLCQHEAYILRQLKDIPQTPKLLTTYKKTGLIYTYIEGKSLDEKPDIPENFFDRLTQLTKTIHQQNIAYVDMNKRGNILVGSDNLPYIIDFQISCKLHSNIPGLRKILNKTLHILIKEDYRHILKHKNRLCRHLMTSEEIATYSRKSIWIRMHRKMSRPLTKLRRRFLYFLYNNNCLPTDATVPMNHENDPERWNPQPTTPKTR